MITYRVSFNDISDPSAGTSFRFVDLYDNDIPSRLTFQNILGNEYYNIITWTKIMNIKIENYRTECIQLGVRLREARTASGLTLKQVAETLNIDEATVSKIENGRWNASIAFYISMAKIYGMEVKIDRT